MSNFELFECCLIQLFRFFKFSMNNTYRIYIILPLTMTVNATHITMPHDIDVIFQNCIIQHYLVFDFKNTCQNNKSNTIDTQSILKNLLIVFVCRYMECD